MPPPYVDMIYELLYPDYAQQMIPLVGCIDGPNADCREGFAKMTQMYSYVIIILKSIFPLLKS